MITIPLAELKRFLGNAKNIKDTRTLPILSYVKLECKGDSAVMIKTNLNSFVITEIDADFTGDETILIDERVLTGAVNFSEGTEMKISISGKNVVLDDGFSPTYCQSQPAELFPAVETNAGHDKTELSSDVLSALSVAKSHSLISSDKDMMNWMMYVYITSINNKSYVVGTSGGIIYFKTFKEKLPATALDPDTISAIAKYPQLEYSSNGKYDYFQSVGVTYGFIKPETACPKLEPILDQLKSDDSFTINRKEVMMFCEKAISINTAATVPEVSIEDGGNGSLLFKFVAMSDNEGSDKKIKAENKTYTVEQIRFLPRNFLIVIKELPVEKIKISKIKGHMVVTSDEEKDYLGSVMELQKLK